MASFGSGRGSQPYPYGAVAVSADEPRESPAVSPLTSVGRRIRAARELMLVVALATMLGTALWASAGAGTTVAVVPPSGVAAEVDATSSVLTSSRVTYRGDFQEPPLLRAAETGNGGRELSLHMEVLPHRVHYEDAAFNVRSFNGRVPGPTLSLRRGDRLRITLRNLLREDYTLGRHVWNSLRRPNTTGLHAHGLHISPIDSDNIFRIVSAGESLTYEYKIPMDHPQGTFWLHPHFHGSTALQTAFAMAAAIIVEDDEPDLQPLADRVMLLGWLDVGSGKRTDLVEDSRLSGSTMRIDLSPSNFTTTGDDGRRGGFFTVNGDRNPTLAMGARPERWRIVNTVIDGVVRLAYPTNCSVAEIAADGVLYAEPRPRPAEEGVVIPPGSRRDVLIQCRGSAQIRSAIDESAVHDALLRRYLGPGTKVASGDLVFVEIQSNATEESKDEKESKKGGAAALAAAFSVKGEHGYPPEKLHDLRGHTPAVVRDIEFTQGGPGTPKVVRNGDLYTAYGINGVPYSHDSSRDNANGMEVKLDSIVEWTIRNERCMDGSPARESHPFHLHTNHFQVVAFSAESLGKTKLEPDFQIGDFRDTITVPAPGNVTIRFVARDFVGRSVFHCHTLAHADSGMQMAFTIVP